MRRWTDGKSWSASRVSGSFLTYREMEGKRGGGFGSTRRGAGKTPESGHGSDEDLDGSEPDGYRYKADGLMKQSFSITTSGGNHLHLISYYGRPHTNQTDLPIPTSDPALTRIVPVKGMYPESSMNDQPMPATTRTPMASAYSQQQQPPSQYHPQYAHQSYPGWPPSPVATPPFSQQSHHYTVAAPYPGTHLPPPNSQYSQPLQHSPHHPHPPPPHHYMPCPPSMSYDRPLPPLAGAPPRGQPPMLSPYGQGPNHHSPHLPPARPYQESPRLQHLQATAGAAVSDPRRHQHPATLPAINGHLRTTPPPRTHSQSPPNSAHSSAAMTGNKASLSALIHPTPSSSEPNSANTGSNSASSSPRAPYGAIVAGSNGAMTSRFPREPHNEDARQVNVLDKNLAI